MCGQDLTIAPRPGRRFQPDRFQGLHFMGGIDLGFNYSGFGVQALGPSTVEGKGCGLELYGFCLQQPMNAQGKG